MKITALDGRLWDYITERVAAEGLVLRVFCRAGSSLHPDGFTESSDIDYFVVVDKFSPSFVNGFPDRVSPLLDEGRVGRFLHSFYWKVSLQRVGLHDIHIHIYTKSLFELYCQRRSGPKMYLLNEHRFLGGEDTFLERLRAEYPPSIETAKSDLNALHNPKYHHRFLWAWRSVCLLKEQRWLRNKAEITEWVAENYPKGSIANKEMLAIELNAEIIKHDERPRSD